MDLALTHDAAPGAGRARSADASLSAWLCLSAALTPAQGLRLLRRFGAPDAALVCPEVELAGLVGERAARRLASTRSAPLAALHSQTLAWLAARQDRQVLALDDPAYPARLLDLTDPPLLLFVEGHLDCLQAPSLAIVGSRHASRQGQINAQDFAAALAAQGWTVVSGLAVGIDAAAHEGARQTGRTVAVMGTGPDVVYPSSHRALATQIVDHGGALLTEWPVGTPPIASHFPRRNRLIAALAQGVLVVEAALRSGSLITARLANEMGREVFALPGSIHAPQSRGCHSLLKEGAKLVEGIEDLLIELPSIAPVQQRMLDGDSDTLKTGDASNFARAHVKKSIRVTGCKHRPHDSPHPSAHPASAQKKDPAQRRPNPTAGSGSAPLSTSHPPTDPAAPEIASDPPYGVAPIDSGACYPLPGEPPAYAGQLTAGSPGGTGSTFAQEALSSLGPCTAEHQVPSFSPGLRRHHHLSPWLSTRRARHRVAAPMPSRVAMQVLDAMGYDPADFDALLDGSGLSATGLNVALAELEIAGLIERQAGNIYRRLS